MLPFDQWMVKVYRPREDTPQYDFWWDFLLSMKSPVYIQDWGALKRYLPLNVDPVVLRTARKVWNYYEKGAN